MNLPVITIKTANRVVPLSNKIIEMLREYFIPCEPKVSLFEGQKTKEPYDERSF